MRSKHFLFMFPLHLLIGTSTISQNLTGTWSGKSIGTNSAVELTIYLKQLPDNSYAGVSVITAKSGWIVRQNTKIFDKKQTAKKQLYGYVNKEGNLLLKELSVYEKETDYDWTLDKYKFKLSSQDKPTLTSPLLQIGLYQMRFGLTQMNAIVPPEIEAHLVSNNPFSVESIHYISKSTGKPVFRYNDSVKVETTIRSEVSGTPARWSVCFMQIDNEKLLESYTRTGEWPRQNIKLGEKQVNAASFNLRTNYFNVGKEVTLNVSVVDFFTDTDSFLLCSRQVQVPVESFILKQPSKYTKPIANERMKAIGYAYSMEKGDPLAGLKILETLVAKKDRKAQMWRSLFYYMDSGGSEENSERAETLAQPVFSEIEGMARSGDLEAMYLLFYANQILNRPLYEKRFGFSLLKESADYGFPPALYDQATILYAQKKFPECNDYALKAYSSGVGKAAATIGSLYENGLEVKKNVQTAQEWYNKGIAAGSDDAMVAMALLYNNGKDVEPDIAKSITLAKQAVMKNNSRAMLFLGNVYLKGTQGIAASGNAALDWFKKAALLGDKDGMFSLGLLYSNGQSLGIAKDEKSSLFWVKKAAEAGHPSSMELLSKIYFDGIGTDKSLVKSRFWYTQYEKVVPLKTKSSNSNSEDVRSFLNSVDLSPTYYRDMNTGEIFSEGPDLIGGLFSGFLGSYGATRSQVQEQINGMELMYEKRGQPVYGGTVSSNFKSTAKFLKGQRLKITCSGSMKLGWMLSGISPLGTQGYETYSIVSNIWHGAFMVRVNGANWIFAGIEHELVFPEDGYLEVAINDKDYTNNVGYFDFRIEEINDSQITKSNQLTPEPLAKNSLLNANELSLKSTPNSTTSLKAQFIGSWVNVDAGTRDVTKIKISEADGKLAESAWGKCHPVDCKYPIAITTLSDLSDGILVFIRKTSFSIDKQTISLSDDNRLKLEGETKFTDNSGREMMTYVSYFTKAN